MKKISCILTMLAIATLLLGQDTTQSVVRDKHYYQSKGSEQLVMGSILLAGGATALIVASAGNTDFNELPILVIAGSLAAIGGVTLLVCSLKSKKKAKSLTAYFKIETAPSVRQYSFAHRSFPALTLNIRL
jgi:hypothetical protein